MARFTAEQVDNYGATSSGGAGFFSLKNDGDFATVRFLYNTADDIEGYAVHEVEIDGKKRYVNCLREYNQPIDDCPFCRERKRIVAKLFIPVYNEDLQKLQIWERGKKFFSKISGICTRYDDAPIVSQQFDVERHGVAGDTSTQYEIYPTKGTKPDNMTLDDFETPNILGGIVLDKSADDMEYFLERGVFPKVGDDEPISRRRNTRDDDEEDTGSSRRRTPARSRRF